MPISPDNSDAQQNGASSLSISAKIAVAASLLIISCGVAVFFPKRDGNSSSPLPVNQDSDLVEPSDYAFTFSKKKTTAQLTPKQPVVPELIVAETAPKLEQQYDPGAIEAKISNPIPKAGVITTLPALPQQSDFSAQIDREVKATRDKFPQILKKKLERWSDDLAIPAVAAPVTEPIPPPGIDSDLVPLHPEQIEELIPLGFIFHKRLFF